MSGREKMNDKTTGAKVIAEPGFVTGHDFKTTGAKVIAEPGFVTGHDFSRAASDPESVGALAPAGRVSTVATEPATMTLEQVRAELKGAKGKKFIDLIWKPRLLLEMKSAGENLKLHYQQAFDYWITPYARRREAAGFQIISPGNDMSADD